MAPGHVAALLIAQAEHDASKSAATYKMLASRCAASACGEDRVWGVPAGVSLAEFLADLLGRLAAYPADRLDALEEEGRHAIWRLDFSTTAAFAACHWHDDGGLAYIEFGPAQPELLAPAPVPADRITRLVSVPFSAIAVAARVLAISRTARSETASISVPTPVTKKSGHSESENAAPSGKKGTALVSNIKALTDFPAKSRTRPGRTLANAQMRHKRQKAGESVTSRKGSDHDVCGIYP